MINDMTKDDIQRVLNYLDSQHAGFIVDVDVTEILRELCAAELDREPEYVMPAGNVSLEFDREEALWLRRALEGQIAVESPSDYENRQWVLGELPVTAPPPQPFVVDGVRWDDDDNDIPF